MHINQNFQFEKTKPRQREINTMMYKAPNYVPVGYCFHICVCFCVGEGNYYCKKETDEQLLENILFIYKINVYLYNVLE